MRANKDSQSTIVPRPLQPSYHSFLLRLWLECNGTWRGEMVHFQTDQQHPDQPADGLIETLHDIIKVDSKEAPTDSLEEQTDSL